MDTDVLVTVYTDVIVYETVNRDNGHTVRKRIVPRSAVLKVPEEDTKTNTMHVNRKYGQPMDLDGLANQVLKGE